MRVFVTGGAGFIGSHLANQLHQRGHYVRVLDDLSSGEPTQLANGVHFTRGDVRDIPKLWSLLQGVEVVYHLAARVSVPASILYPREYNDVNVGGTVALLEACRDVGVRRVILASSATVYGNQAQQPAHEEMATQPTVPYAVSKVAAEQFLFTIGRLAGFETVALRIFNAYGPGQQLPPVHAPVIPQFMQQIAGGGSIVVQGDGNQTRDFVYIDDVVKALINAAAATAVDQQIINVGSGTELTLNTLIERIAQTVGRKANVLYNRETSGGVARLVADLSKAKQLLTYTPSVDVLTGLARLFQQDPLFRSVHSFKTHP
ncbi:MAG: NAD-dependent epimerase/dehydratase family protein [Caldilineaceae bacterium]|nr:NAD-dependent epimerase/dehydratase family protein [Caldilineaceae bacterium]